MIKKAVNPIYDKQFDLDPAKSNIKYVIYSQQRTGSTWLCNRLINFKNFGVPAEYLNQRAMQEMIDKKINNGAIKLANYMELLINQRTSMNGYFGIKVQPNQLRHIFKQNIHKKIEYLNSFDRVIAIGRDDKLNQAISATIAMLTDQWWTYDGKIDAIPEEKINRVMMMISANLNRMIIEDYETEQIIQNINKPLLKINYSQIQENSENILNKVVQFLMPESDIQKLKEYDIVDIPVKAEKEIPQNLRESFLAYIN